MKNHKAESYDNYLGEDRATTNNAHEKDLQCKVYPVGTLSPLKYVVVCSYFEGKVMLSRHKKRSTWETQGGHIEIGESPMDAAKRELFEESGVEDAELYPVCDYLGYDSVSSSNGVVFLAVVRSIGKMPKSEMKDIMLFDDLPNELTYPSVTPQLFKKAKEFADNNRIFKY